ASGPRAALWPRRPASAHAGRGRPRVQRHTRAYPADREPVAEEAPRAGRRGQIARSGVASRFFPAPFIVGAGRSGNTLLRLMLDAHPQLAIPPETDFIPDVTVASECAA